MTSMVLNLFEITVSFEQLIKFFNLFSRKIHKYTHTFLHTNLGRVTVPVTSLQGLPMAVTLRAREMAHLNYVSYPLPFRSVPLRGTLHSPPRAGNHLCHR